MSEVEIMRILREANNYSQEYVASVLDIEQNTYSKLESGRIKLTVDRVKKLAELYGVKPDYFFNSDGPVIHYNKGEGSSDMPPNYIVTKPEKSQSEYENPETDNCGRTINLSLRLAELFLTGTSSAIHNNIGTASNSNSGFIQTYVNDYGKGEKEKK